MRTRSFFATVNVGGSMTFNGTGNLVDGTINNWAEDGEPRQDLPEDAVEEFKVSNAGYKAEFGLATGGVVQVVTKSGSQHAARHRVRVLPRQVAQRARRVRGREAGLPPQPVRRQRRRPDRPRQMHFFGSVERTRHRRVLYRSDRPAAVLLVARRHVPAAVDAKPLLRPHRLADEQHAESSSPAIPARTSRTLQRLRRHRAHPRPASTRTCRASRSSLGHTWLRGTRQLNDFRFQYAHAAFYGYPAGTEIWNGNRRIPGRAHRPADAAVQLPVADLRQQLRPDRARRAAGSSGTPMRINLVAPRASSSAANTTTCRTSSTSTGNSLSAPTTFSRDQFFDPEQSGVDRGPDRRRNFAATARRSRPRTRRNTTSASSRTTGGCGAT